MTIKHPKIKYLKDYTPSNFLIDTAQLTIDLADDIATITTTMTIKKNTDKKTSENNLTLNGESQKLINIQINDVDWPENQYQLEKQSLIILNVPDTFTLKITSETKPKENTQLSGLYQSRGMFCTQCEPEGFRRITYFLDRPDILVKFKTKIIADKRKRPLLLSNGNLIEQGDLPNQRHYAIWEDPFRKPSYLFAMVAGDLDMLEDHFITMSGRKITLRIYTEKGETEKCQFAMEALKKAMKWDEENYGREYDLNVFMLVAVYDFNVGAMENKGLNIFNTKYVFADPKTATDTEYFRLEGVVGHEYFHNWTGNRVTCRDWFQLSLKEGLTVFRDQSFSEDMGSKSVARIEEVKHLRTLQFLEDAGPLAHPIQPSAYMEINNFYTMTIYEKGAEVIRMIQTMLGKSGFRRGMDLYFERHDGAAATCENFVASMEDANHIDLKQFRLWYSQAGTPELTIHSNYDSDKKTYQLTIKQYCPPTPGQNEKKPMHIPLAIGLLDKDGNDIPLNKSDIIHIQTPEQVVTFENIDACPTPSLLRHFSAPVKIHYDYTQEELAFLMTHDNDNFARFEAGQQYALNILINLIRDAQQQKTLALNQSFIDAYRKLLLDDTSDPALIAHMLQLPSEVYMGEFIDIIDVDAIHTARQFVRQTLADTLRSDFLNIYQRLNAKTPYKYSVNAMANRALKNACLSYLSLTQQHKPLCFEQFQQTDNMTDKMAALTALSHIDCRERDIALEQFYNAYQHNDLVIDKWFAVQAASTLPKTVDTVEQLLKHPAFNIKNPNRVYSVLITFATNNPVNFHTASGKGYQLLSEKILEIDTFNQQVASRITKPLTYWQRHTKARQALIKSQLKNMLSKPALSNNVYEVVEKGLKE